MATLICILKNDAVGRGGVTERREVVCRIFPINASALWAKFVPCSTSEGSESIYRKHRSLTPGNSSTLTSNTRSYRSREMTDVVQAAL